MTRLLLAFVIGATLTAPAAAGDAAAGAVVFKKCASCHAVGEGAKNKVGPVLNGLFGRPAGTIPDFKYSDANRNSGIVWSEETFATYIRDPRGVVKGTKMAFVGLKSDKEVDDIIAFLKQYGPDGKPHQ